MFSEKSPILGPQYYITAGALLLAYYLVPYFQDPHNFRRRFPGPLSASLSSWWLSKNVQSGHHSETLRELHERYGKFVRIAPNHISIADPNALEAGLIMVVYSHSSGMLKSEFYEAFRTDKDGDVFTSRDKAIHTMKRKRVANIYSAQNVLAFEPRVRSHIERFCAQLDMRCEQSLKGVSGFNWDVKDGRAIINCCPQFSYLAFDIISDLALGVPFGLIDAQKDSTPAAFSLISDISPEGLPVIQIISDSSEGSAALGSYSRLVQKFLLFFRPWDTSAQRNFRKIATAAVEAKASKLENGMFKEESGGADLLDKLFETRNHDGSPLSKAEIYSEAMVIIGAGSDTTSNTLSALCYYVASDPQVKIRLQEELDSIHPLSEMDDFEENQSAHGIPSFEQVKNLPYLNACIKEALRLYSTLGIGLPRVVPAGKSLTVSGETFNEGSVISVPSYSTNRSSVWGAEPEEYRPERWLENGSESLNKYYVPFSTGPRACLGRNLATMDLALISATFFRRYDVQLATPTTKLGVKEGFVREAIQCDVAIKRRA
ncbi:unnamed protein product [Rhizoctonia solani]|uniref:Benzoate 4-monooxygenase n=1 Tax=Rhizoctonia solani TaxID=456999 RepID=A0A8H3BWV9_9AGAM|nr:unnamed protein product [Rhizoctonia solani]